MVQYTHISLWCLVAAPLFIGCDLEKLDDFTLNLLTNDEVLAIDQDSLGHQGRRLMKEGNFLVFGKELEDGSKAIGFFNLSLSPMLVNFHDFAKLLLSGKYTVRDLWRQKDLASIDPKRDHLALRIPAHGVLLYKFTPSK